MSEAGSATDHVTPAAIEQAVRRLAYHLRPTPLQYSQAFTDQVGSPVHIKIESVQPIRAFKVRGALNKIGALSLGDREFGVITASAGNHGLGVAYAAAVHKIPATVFVPETANQLKVDAINRLGARVMRGGRSYHDAYLEAKRVQAATGATFVHAYDDVGVIVGQGTIGIEILADLADVDTVLVPVGGGGLISGIATYIKEKRPRAKVIGVEPAGADAMARSLKAGQIVTLDKVVTIADGLAASAPGLLTFDLSQRYVDDVITVQEDEMLRAIRLLLEWEHLLAEPAGAAAFAGLLYHHRPVPNEKIVVLLSGANVTGEVLIRALNTR